MKEMKEKLLLVGSGGLGRVVLEHALKEYDCSFVDDGYSIGDSVCGASIVGHISDIDMLYSNYKNLFVSIGDNSLREKIYDRAEKIGYSFPNIIHSSVYISPFARIGKGCLFLNNVVIQNGSSVGNGVILNPGVEIHHDSFIDDYSLIYTNSVIRTLARVGRRSKIGSNCTISNNIVLGKDSILNNGCTI